MYLFCFNFSKRRLCFDGGTRNFVFRLNILQMNIENCQPLLFPMVVSLQLNFSILKQFETAKELQNYLERKIFNFLLITLFFVLLLVVKGTFYFMAFV